MSLKKPWFLSQAADVLRVVETTSHEDEALYDLSKRRSEAAIKYRVVNVLFTVQC